MYAKFQLNKTHEIVGWEQLQRLTIIVYNYQDTDVIGFGEQVQFRNEQCEILGVNFDSE